MSHDNRSITESKRDRGSRLSPPPFDLSPLPGTISWVETHSSRRWRVRRLVLGALLLVAVATAVTMLFLLRPTSLAITASLILLIGLAIAGLTHLFVPLNVEPRTKRTITVGVAIVTILAALLAIPTLRDGPRGATSSEQPASKGASESPSRQPELLSATVIRGPVGDIPNCVPYVVPTATTPDLTKPSADSPEAERDWIRAVGAIDVGETDIEIRLQGLSEKSVILNELRVVIDSIAEPSNKDIYNVAFGCGGGFSPRLYSIDLESTTPKATPLPGEDERGQQPPQPFPLKVSVSDPETLIVYSSTKQKDITWHLEIPWYSAGQEGTLIIKDADGRSFRTLSPRRTIEGYYFDPETKDWEKWCSPSGPVPC